MANKKNILSVIGTRPQYIKYAALSSVLRNSFHEILVDTGQHYDFNLSDIFLSEFSIHRPDRKIILSSIDSGSQITEMIHALSKILREEKPNAVLCFGDTNSTLAAAFASIKSNVPVIHVESGERNYTQQKQRVSLHTIPEEINRFTVDHLSSLLLCASRRGVTNLLEEHATGHIEFTGDIMYDLYLKNLNRILQSTDVLQRFSISPQSYFYCTIHRALNTDNKERLTSIIEAFKLLDKLIIIPLHPRTEKMLRHFDLMKYVESLRNIQIIQPLNYSDSIALSYHAYKVITDSGGVVREAFFNHVPSIFIDDTTEWIDIFESGWGKICGSDTMRIIESTVTRDIPSTSPDLFGTGNATYQTMENIQQCLQ